MSKLPLKKLLLGSLIVLQLTNASNVNVLNKVYAKEEKGNQIYLDEDGKILQLIGFKINGYETITFGYLYVKDNSVYLKDAKNGRIFNLTKISENYIPISALYGDAIEVLTNEQVSKGYITKEEANELSKSFYITQDTTKINGINGNVEVYQDITYDTFSKENFNNKEFDITNCTGFTLKDKIDNNFYSSNSTDNYNENLSQDNTSDNDYKLGILERYEKYPYYEDIYQKVPLGITDQMGIITGYYVLDENNQIVATLKTQEEIDKFLETHHDKLNNYIWKASYYNGTNIKDVLEAIDNNEPISYTYTTRFIDYSPACKKLKNN